MDVPIFPPQDWTINETFQAVVWERIILSSVWTSRCCNSIDLECALVPLAAQETGKENSGEQITMGVIVIVEMEIMYPRLSCGLQ